MFQIWDAVFHKALIPFNLNDLFGIGGIFIAILVNTVAGIGGGGIILPILVLVMKFSLRQAIALSNLVVFGSALASAIVNLTKRHPNPFVDRPLISFDIVLLMEPITMIGALCGTYIGKIIPEIFLVISLGIVLATVSWRSYTIGMQQYLLEANETNSNISNFLQTFEEASDSINSVRNQYSSLSFENVRIEEKEESPLIIDIEESNTPIGDLLALTLLTIVVTLLTLAKSSNNSHPVMKCSGILYWLDNFIILMVVAIFAIVYRYRFYKKWEKRIQSGYLVHEGEFNYILGSSLIYSLCYCLAGIFAGASLSLIK